MSNFCKNCGQKLNPNEKFCGNCGAPNINQKPIQQPQVQAQQNETRDKKQEMKDAASKFLRSGFIIYPLLLLFPPIGIPYMWFMNKSYSTKKKVILTVIFGLWLVYLVKSPRPQQEQPKPQTPQEQAQQILQTQQTAQEGTQEGQQSTAQPRKNFGKVKDYWKNFNAELKTLPQGLELQTKDETGYLSLQGDYSEQSVWIELDTPFLSDEIQEVKVRLHQKYLRNDDYLGAFIVGCAKTVDMISPDLSEDERNEILTNLHIINNSVEPGSWKEKHNDVEYKYINDVINGKGITFIATPIAKKK